MLRQAALALLLANGLLLALQAGWLDRLVGPGPASAQREPGRLERQVNPGLVQVVPQLDPTEMSDGNFFGLTSGYLTRAQATVPKQGVRHPWKVHHNYARDYASLKLGKVDDGVLQFSGPVKASRAA